MFGKMFKREGHKEEASAPAAAPKGQKPREIHASVGRDLVVKYREDPDWVWKLKQVQKPSEQGEHIRDFRVYDAATAGSRGIAVREYASLDEHPDLILYHGWLNVKNNEVQVLGGVAYQQKAS
ncbi:MAG: hypothetical protein K9K66_04850 [Desulfarculaceae bacterium]|nr:hypothetical protein [Desulfarculaceae bacterium]MCF8072800.1 hypothetical protein [Desulfarculaceae bacterium]MCF8100968.1 hypothetical protein [Desulfarculaceae bacterium]MCF8118532.1 hypothetical protein [Desulfarculaceae bacterium]